MESKHDKSNIGGDKAVSVRFQKPGITYYEIRLKMVYVSESERVIN
jgi:hypothetical protein